LARNTESDGHVAQSKISALTARRSAEVYVKEMSPLARLKGVFKSLRMAPQHLSPNKSMNKTTKYTGNAVHCGLDTNYTVRVG